MNRGHSAILGALLFVLPIFTTCGMAQIPSPSLSYFSFGGGTYGEYGLWSGAGVIAGGSGELYGTASSSGDYTNCRDGCGTVYEAVPPSTPDGVWSMSVIYTFHGGKDGADPGNLVMDHSGTIYGVTRGGGAAGAGTVFALTPPAETGGAWKERTLYTFTGGADGSGPVAPLVIGADGVLYGVAPSGGVTTGSCTSEGAAAGCGTVFSLTPPAGPGDGWTFNLLYSFMSYDDGITPGGVVLDPSGILYGNTVYGGSSNCPYGLGFRGCGTVFSLTSPAPAPGAWTKNVVYSFQGGTDGSRPNGVTLGTVPGESTAVLYGTTSRGGNPYACGRGGEGCGTAYMLAPPSAPGDSWTETIITDFPESRGFHPSSSLATGRGGVLFGTTSGALNSGFTVYMLIPPTLSGSDWKKEVLSEFSSSSPGSPANVLLLGGNLYGATYYGGDSNGGTVWALLETAPR
jgi:uncharacterized repeat protein (TIGR03803 family)